MSLSQAQWAGAPRSLPLLPIECLLLITHYSEPGTLQNFRLASRAFQRLADPVLWRTVRLVPNIDCLESFLDLIKTSSIAPHIQTLVYDTSWQTLVDEIKFKSEAYPSSPNGGIDRPLLARCIDGDVRSAEGSAVEMCLLTRIFDALPRVSSLQSIMPIVPRRDHQRSSPPYYRAICNKAGLRLPDPVALRLPIFLISVSHVRSLLLAAYASSAKIDSLELIDLSWSSFFQEPNAIIQPPYSRLGDFRYRQHIFKSLKFLHVTFRNQPSRDPDLHLRSLREVLKGCVNLVCLRIRFNDHVEKKYAPNYRMFSYLAPFVEGQSMRPLMPKLSELHIDSCLCTQSELLHFLMIHSSTLRVLGLSNISLLQPDGGDTRGCWVHVIHSLKHALRLNKITFREWLSNGGRQRWFVSQDNPVDPSRLRPQIEKFVTRQSNFIPQILTAVALRPGQDDVPTPSEGVEVEGDWTWTMTYGLKSRYERRDTLYSGNDLFSKDVALKKAVSDSLPEWSDWLSPKLAHPCPALQSASKTKSPVSTSYSHWSHSNLGPPLHAKKMPSSQKQPAQPPLSSNWGAFGSSSSVDNAWTGTPPPFPITFQSTPNSSKSDSIHSTGSYLAYTEDDATIGDLSSYHSPSQHSPGPTIPSYTPSHSSYSSGATFDSLASWPQSLPPLHAVDPSSTGDGSSAPSASKQLITHPEMDMGDIWIDPWDFLPPPPNELAMPPPAPASGIPPPQLPKSLVSFKLEPSSTSGQNVPLCVGQAFSPSEAVALLKQKQSKNPHYTNANLKQSSSPEPQTDASKPSVTYPFTPEPQIIDEILAAHYPSVSAKQT
ncbi:hypothetical protein DV738_g1385, partial [Chaetothyriales sp. CBS 135597]